MKFSRDTFFIGIILSLVIIIFLQKSCVKPTPVNDNTTVVTKIVTKYDTIIREVPTYVPKWKTKIVREIDSFPIPIDTAEILKDYFTLYYYEDSLIKDSLKLYIKDTITENKIKNRTINYSLIYPTTTIYRDSLVKRNEFFYGFGLVGNQEGIYYIGPEFLLKTKYGNAYGLGIGINGDLQPTLGIKTYWKFGKK